MTDDWIDGHPLGSSGMDFTFCGLATITQDLDIKKIKSPCWVAWLVFFHTSEKVVDSISGPGVRGKQLIFLSLPLKINENISSDENLKKKSRCQL